MTTTTVSEKMLLKPFKNNQKNRKTSQISAYWIEALHSDSFHQQIITTLIMQLSEWGAIRRQEERLRQ
jgi:hypothetical protein